MEYYDDIVCGADLLDELEWMGVAPEPYPSVVHVAVYRLVQQGGQLCEQLVDTFLYEERQIGNAASAIANAALAIGRLLEGPQPGCYAVEVTHPEHPTIYYDDFYWQPAGSYLRLREKLRETGVVINSD